ncbi:MAG TPA: RHS repeat-associated core domain-containing protein, partial [Pirellulales bacterium]|nr:RHS repeat-associated core domain-containing protein [Pirellulales bacterium]
AGVYLDEFYQYDGLYRLAYLQRGQLNSTNTGIIPDTQSFTQQWLLDPTGNWIQFQQNDSSGTLDQFRSANTVNEITGISSPWVTPSYDAVGNMVSMPQPANPTSVARAVFDAWSRVRTITIGSTVVSALYDALNRRASKTISSSVRDFYYTSAWQAIEERVGGATLPDRQFLWGLRYIDDLVLRDRGTERLYALQDPNWNVSAITAPDGYAQERYDYSGYGQPTFLTAGFGVLPASQVDWETLFAGYRWDSESGVYAVRRRGLHTQIGSWISRDEMPQFLFIRSENLYEYCGSAPLDHTDPFGLVQSQPHGQAVEGIMVHSEIEPGQAAGNVHLQKGGAKWYINPDNRDIFSIDPKTGTRQPAPKSLTKIIQRSQKLQRQIDNAINRVNANGGFAPRFLGGALVTGAILLPYDQYVEAGESKGKELVRRGPLCNTLNCIDSPAAPMLPNETASTFTNAGVTYSISAVAINGKCYFHASHTESRFSIFYGSYDQAVFDIGGTECEARNRRPIGGVCSRG